MKAVFTPIPAAGLALALVACASGTDGRIVAARFAVQAEAEPDRALGEFETATGWTVTLDRAELALSAVYAFAPDERPDVVAQVSRLLVPVAHAHGGHDPLTGKRVRAEWIEPVVVDLLDGELRVLGEVDAEAGAIDTVAVDLAAPGADVAVDLGGRQIRVSGEARRGGERIAFEGGLRVPGDGLTRRVEARAPAIELDQGDTLVLGLRPSVWLRDAAFDRLADAGAGEPRAITAESQVGRALFLGARSPDGLSLSLAPEDLDD